MTDVVPPEPGLRTIQSVDRAAALLKAVAASRDPLSVVELAAQCGLNRSTAWRLLATLDSQGLVERDPVTQRYSVGYAIFRGQIQRTTDGGAHWSPIKTPGA